MAGEATGNFKPWGHPAIGAIPSLGPGRIARRFRRLAPQRHGVFDDGRFGPLDSQRHRPEGPPRLEHARRRRTASERGGLVRCSENRSFAASSALRRRWFPSTAWAGMGNPTRLLDYAVEPSSSTIPLPALTRRSRFSCSRSCSRPWRSAGCGTGSSGISQTPAAQLPAIARGRGALGIALPGGADDDRRHPGVDDARHLAE